MTLASDYVEIPHKILLTWARTNIGGTDAQCLWVVILHTYGERQTAAAISYDVFASETRRPKRSVWRALNRLTLRNILIKTSINYGVGYTLKAWSVNENTNQWSKSQHHSISAETRNKVLDRDGHRCVNCGSTNYLSIDHIVPRSRGGDDSESNLQTLCNICNSKKGNKLVVTDNPLQ